MSVSVSVSESVSDSVSDSLSDSVLCFALLCFALLCFAFKQHRYLEPYIDIIVPALCVPDMCHCDLGLLHKLLRVRTYVQAMISLSYTKNPQAGMHSVCVSIARVEETQSAHWG